MSDSYFIAMEMVLSPSELAELIGLLQSPDNIHRPPYQQEFDSRDEPIVKLVKLSGESGGLTVRTASAWSDSMMKHIVVTVLIVRKVADGTPQRNFIAKFWETVALFKTPRWTNPKKK
ncbi:MAG: hypothetical protein AAB817_01595 [Patescibacteria group bacterium]